MSSLRVASELVTRFSVVSTLDSGYRSVYRHEYGRGYHHGGRLADSWYRSTRGGTAYTDIGRAWSLDLVYRPGIPSRGGLFVLLMFCTLVPTDSRGPLRLQSS